MRLVLALSALLVTTACGGSSSEPKEPTPAEPAEPAEPEVSEGERKLRAAQANAVHAMCERLVDCAVEEASREQTAEEAAQSSTPAVLDRARAECESGYGQVEMSPRQIKLVQRCVNEARACAALEACLAEA
jgi:hypothetical protein